MVLLPLANVDLLMVSLNHIILACGLSSLVAPADLAIPTLPPAAAQLDLF